MPRHSPTTRAAIRFWHRSGAAVGFYGLDVYSLWDTTEAQSMGTPAIDAACVAGTADRVLPALEEHRSTSQICHVRAGVRRRRGFSSHTTDKSVVTAAATLPPAPCGHPRLGGRSEPHVSTQLERRSQGCAELLATISTALAIIGVLAITALADHASALGLTDRAPYISYDWAL